MNAAKSGNVAKAGAKAGLPADAREWLLEKGFAVRDEDLWYEALTHGSTGNARDYQRLEFLGDRVLGLTVAALLYERTQAAEGALAQRLNALVSRSTCAAVAREIGAARHLNLGKQARDDGAADSDNILGDVMEALLGANFVEAGFEASSDLIRSIWDSRITGGAGASKHPKSALQEWAAGNRRKGPEYAIIDRSGPDHMAEFTVRVSVKNVGEAEAPASSKQEAETEAARLFMERFG
ncbi:MAG: ribonuclease III [Allopontixanthobacter sediminis]